MGIRVLALLLILLAGTVAIHGEAVTTASPVDFSAYPWFYLRDGRPPVAGEETVELILAGDVSFGRETAAGYRPAGANPLAAVAPWLRAADLVLGNLESVLVADGTPAAVPEDAYLLRGRPADALSLAAAGFDLVSVANNHAFDYGATGLSASKARLTQLGVMPVDGEAAVREVGGVRIAFLAFNQVRSAAASAAALPSLEEMVDAVAAARAEADVVVVSVHWGYEYELRPDPAQARLAGALRVAGADVIAGHHPHVAQPVAVVEGGLVAYSLGNFLFDQGEGEQGRGLAVRVLLDKAGVRAVQGLPLHAAGRPALLSPAEAEDFLARVAPPPPRAAFVHAHGDHYRRVPTAQEPATGFFWSGQADLTGDGQPEQVRREGQRVHIYAGGALVWESPPAWEVADLALGDPNDDGRQELLLAVWKEDPAGYRRSHPYLVGYRGGAYALIWGGRAVMDPIQEVVLGDVDGDGRQELLVLLEDADGSARTVAVWRWHGWGFSLLWQSPPGPYRDLVFLAPADGMPATFSAALVWE